MSGANGMSWFDAFLNAAVMSFFLGWMFFDEGDTLVETEGIDWDGDTGCEVEDYEWEYLDEA
jgi:hypothetical protein|tara:strand:+ start:34 stop:219 length:186 start_codon:yes stop_codon:yes gene_type:complete